MAAPILEDSAFIDDIDDLGDLFGDEQPALPTALIHNGLAERLDELAICGCTQKISWSRFGAVASVSKDAKDVHIQVFHWEPKTKLWALSEKAPIETSSYSALSDVVHVSWNTGGLELAVLDISGRISIFALFIALNRLRMTADFVADQTGSFGRIVGFDWLPPPRAGSLYSSYATRKDSKWTYSSASAKNTGPVHPNNKSALVCVTRGGQLRLLFQGADPIWHETTAEIENVTSTEHLMTHASFGFETDSSILLVVHDESQRLRSYRIILDWNVPADIRRPLPASFIVSPQITVHPLHELRNCEPLPESLPSSSLDMFDGQRNLNYAHLTQLQVHTSLSEPSGGRLDPAVISAVFSTSQGPANLSMAYNRHSIISRWKISEVNQALLPVFEQLAAKKSNAKIQPPKGTITVYTRMDDITVDGCIVGFSLHKMNSILAICLDDGSIQFREVADMQLLIYDSDASKITCMAQGGFNFSATSPCLHAALSTHSCIVATRLEGDEIQLKYPELSKRSDAVTESGAALAALCLAFADSGHQHVQQDDLIAVFQQNLAILDVPSFLKEVHQATDLNVDCTPQNPPEMGMALLKNPFLFRSLCAQNNLGRSENTFRLSAKIAWILVNLRSLTMNMHFIIQSAHSNDQQNIDVTLWFIGIIKWFNDLMTMIIDDCISLSRIFLVFEHADGQSDKERIQAAVDELNTPAICLLLHSLPRVFLRSNVRTLRGLRVTAKKRLAGSLDRRSRKGWTIFEAAIEDNIVPFERFEMLVAEMEEWCRKGYAEAKTSDADRRRMERDFLITGTIPEPLVPIAKRLLTHTLTKLQDDVDASRLYFADLRWLGISSDEATVQFAATHKLDIVRKVLLPADTRVRQCPRCCALSEDLSPAKAGSAFLAQMLRSCVCGMPWMLPANDS